MLYSAEIIVFYLIDTVCGVHEGLRISIGNSTADKIRGNISGCVWFNNAVDKQENAAAPQCRKKHK